MLFPSAGLTPVSWIRSLGAVGPGTVLINALLGVLLCMAISFPEISSGTVLFVDDFERQG